MPLAPFGAVDRSALRWLRTARSPDAFALSSNETPIATLVWAGRTGSLATASTADTVWTFKRAGFLAPQITVRTPGSDASVARLIAHLRDHELRLAGGPTYRLFRQSLLPPGWRLSGPEGAEVLHIEPAGEGRSLDGGAVLVGARRDAPELPLVVLLSWYFVVLSWLEDELVEALAPFEGPDAPTRPSWASR